MEAIIEEYKLASDRDVIGKLQGKIDNQTQATPPPLPTTSLPP